MIRRRLDKNTVEETAERFVRKGQFDRALTELERLVGTEGADAHTFHKIADIYLKKDDTRSATASLLQAADAYSSNGFFSKATAIYNQILKLDPSMVEVNRKLAEMQRLRPAGERRAE
jgi:pilus assembly protein FimV